MLCILIAIIVATAPFSSAARCEGIRAPADSVGYALYPAQIERISEHADMLERHFIQKNARNIQRRTDGPMIGAICPHDDYLYAAPVYAHVMREVQAPLVILIGVCHAARKIGLQGKLIFDDFDAWQGPYGLTPVSSLRERVISLLPPELVLVSNELHSKEHSLEAFIPYLQHYGQIRSSTSFDQEEVAGPEILPILVPRLPGKLFERAAVELAEVLAAELAGLGLAVGADYQFLISADCVHYGDEAWGSGGYAPFGVDTMGYSKGVEQDIEIAQSSLTGILSEKRISHFRELVENNDLEWPYKVTWCGVYSIPFGLRVMLEMSGFLGRDVPIGILLRYATSLDPGALPLEDTGLGKTNIATLRHWVGYAAIGYWRPADQE
jgi:AmmeMemoRadiSam system protein B